MRVVVFGANGSTGQEVMRQGVAAGHEMVAAVRRPETVEHIDGIETAKIDLKDPASLEAAMVGADVIVSTIGHGGVRAASKPTTMYSDSVRSFRDAMRKTGVKRIMVMSSSGMLEDPAAPTFYNKLLRRYLINSYIDMARMETILEETDDLEWTSVRLSYLRSGPSKPFLVKNDQLGEGSFQIHHTDAARFIVEELEERKWVSSHPTLGYP